MTSVFGLIKQACSRTPDLAAIVDTSTHQTLDYRTLIARIESAAAGFVASGCGAGDVVAVISPNSIGAIITTLALHRVGIVPALMNPRLKADEYCAMIRAGSMRACVISASAPAVTNLLAQLDQEVIFFTIDGTVDGVVDAGQFPEGAAVELPAHRSKAEDAAFVFYTSGTTGLPKGAVIPDRATEARVLFMATQVGHSYGPHNRIAGLMPLYHVIGFYAVLVMALAFNGTYFLFSEFNPDAVLDAVEKYQITGLFATPTHLDSLTSAMKSKRQVRSLDLVTFAGATMPDAVLSKVNRAFPGRKVNIYGTTEAMNSLYMTYPSTGTRLRPGYGSEVRVGRFDAPFEALAEPGEIGELIVSMESSAMFSGYLGPDNSVEHSGCSGWYRTKDAAIFHTNGDIEILGRLDDTIISGGENIHPQEVERVLSAHNGISEVAVIGMPDQRWGQVVAACFVPSGSDISPEDLDDLCRASDLADFKRPRQYFTVKILPRNPTGKLLRKELLNMVLTSSCDQRSKTVRYLD